MTGIENFGIPEYVMEQGETAFMQVAVIVSKYYRKLIAEGTPDTLAHELAVAFQNTFFGMVGLNIVTGGNDD